MREDKRSDVPRVYTSFMIHVSYLTRQHSQIISRLEIVQTYRALVICRVVIRGIACWWHVMGWVYRPGARGGRRGQGVRHFS
jgi:hypothetical protein